MTRKHFVALAGIVAAVADRETRTELACRLADELREQNSRFDGERFLAACGVDSDDYRKVGGFTAISYRPVMPSPSFWKTAL